MNGRHYEPITAEGCVSSIGWFIGAFFALSVLILVIGGVFTYFGPPNKVCKRFEDFKVIEQVDIGNHTAPTLVTKQVCAEWEEPKP